MGLAQFQAALALLYTDSDFRTRLRDGATGVLELDLTSEEYTQIVTLATRDSRVDRFAGSLIAKRRAEMAKLLPVSAQLAGERFVEAFGEYAAASGLNGPNKHARDAVRFGRWLARAGIINEPWAREVARFEADRVEVWLNRPVLRARLYRYPVVRLAAQIINSEMPAEREAKQTGVLWYRMGKNGDLCLRVLF